MGHRNNLLAAIIIHFILLSGWSCSGQNRSSTTNNERKVGGYCEICHLYYEGLPKNIDMVDTTAAWGNQGANLLVTGTVYKPDGKTPAPGVVVYYYHTDERGYYPRETRPGMPVTRHGQLRGWVKSNEQGQYYIYTIRPAPYPTLREPAHIHMIVKEEGFSEYNIDDVFFDDDSILTHEMRERLNRRGGTGIVNISSVNGMLRATRDIFLGRNIEGY